MARGERKRPLDDVGSAVSQASARDEPGIGERRANALIAHEGAEAGLVAVQAAQHEPREVADTGGAPEQAGVPGHSAHRGGVVVVHLSCQRTAAPRTVSGAHHGAGRHGTERRWHRGHTGEQRRQLCIQRAGGHTLEGSRRAR